MCAKRCAGRAAEAIFNQMVSFAEYAFNKSHAAAYAVVAYETGYLKSTLSGRIHGGSDDQRDGGCQFHFKVHAKLSGDGNSGAASVIQ